MALAQQVFRVHDAARQAGQLLPSARQAGAAQGGVRAPQAIFVVEHGTAEQVARVENLAHLAPDSQEISPQCVPDGLVDGVGRRAAVLARDSRGPRRGVEGLGGGGGADVAGQGLLGCAMKGVVEIIKIG